MLMILLGILILIIILLTGYIIIKSDNNEATENVRILIHDLKSLEAYLAKTEASKNLYGHANKEIVWFNEKQKTDMAVIYLHGYSASRTEIDPVPMMVAKALGANLYYARFTGHGIQDEGESFKGVKPIYWYTDALEALAIGRALGNQVIIMGHSTGCTFGTWLAHLFPQYVKAQLYLAPNYYPADKGVMAVALPGGKALLRLVKGEFNTFDDEEMKPKEGKEPIWSLRQHIDAVVAMVSVVKKVQKLRFENMTVPLLIICSPYDKVVRTAYTKRIFKRYGTPVKQLILLENSTSGTQHTITGEVRDYKTIDTVADAMIDFVNRLDEKKVPYPSKEL